MKPEITTMEVLLAKIEKLSDSSLAVINDMIDTVVSVESRLTAIRSTDRFKTMTEMGYLAETLLGNFATGILIEGPDAKFLVAPKDYGVGYDLRIKGRYGLSEINYIKPFLTKRSNLLVIGAHIGALVIPLSRYCSKVVAIEANPESYTLLEANLLLNSIKNCQQHNIAASEKKEIIQFYLNTANSGGSKRKPVTEHYYYNYDNPRVIDVQAYALDQYLAICDFEVIVMDIEGSEYFALKGMQKILEKAKVLVVEFLPHHLKNVSNVSVADFVELLHMFNRLTLPSKNITVGAEDFEAVLKYMFDHDINEEGIIFEKVS